MKASTLKLLAISMIITFVGSHKVMAKDIICHTSGMTKVFVIKENRVSFFNPLSRISNSREIASVVGVRTKIFGEGFTKITYVDNNKYMIHVDNKKSFSNVNDYLTIRTKKGHEMTYPLECSLK